MMKYRYCSDFATVEWRTLQASTKGRDTCNWSRLCVSSVFLISGDIFT